MATRPKKARSGGKRRRKTAPASRYGKLTTVRVGARNITVYPSRPAPAPWSKARPLADIFPAPRVTAAMLAEQLVGEDPDSIVLAEFKGQDLLLEWDGYEGDVFSGDSVTFEYGNAIPIDTVIVDPTTELPIQARFPASLVWNTDNTIKITVFYQGQNGGLRSPSRDIVIDTTKPGLPRPAALEFDPADDIPGSGITAAKLRDDGDGSERYIWAQIPSYDGTAKGDVYKLVCNGKETTYSYIPFTGNHVVKIGEAFLEEVGDIKKARLSYYIKDRAGNISEESTAVTIDIQLGAIAMLEEPRVPAYDDDPDDDVDNPPLIDEADARGAANAGLLVIVPWNDEFVAGDQIIISIGDIAVAPVTVVGMKDDIRVQVSYAATQAAWQAGSPAGADVVVNAMVTYQVFRGSADMGTSPGHPVDINLYQKVGDPDPDTPENEELEPPELESDSGELDLIPADDFKKDAKIRIAKQTKPPRVLTIEAGDTLRVYYGKQAAIEHVVDDVGTPSTPIEITLPAATIEAEGSAESVPLWYEIVHDLAGGGTNTNLSPTKSIRVEGTDRQPGRGELAAGIFLDRKDANVLKDEVLRTRTRFEIPDYENRDADDDVTITIDLYRDVVHLPGEVPYPIEHYRWTSSTFHPGIGGEIVREIPASVYNIQGNTEWPLPFAPAPAGTGRRNQITATYSSRIHMHATYTITKKRGDTTPVTSDVASIGADCRFVEPPIPEDAP